MMDDTQRRKRLPPYSEAYGTFPAHWEVRRLKHLASVNISNVDKHSRENESTVLLCNYTDVYNNEYITDELDFMEATAPQHQIERFGLRKGDVIVTKDSESWDDIAVPALVRRDLNNVICGYHLALIRPDSSRLDPRYLFRSFSSFPVAEQFKVAASGVTRFGLGKSALENALFPVPPIDEQRLIATFLERETARIDALIEKKRELIDRLREKRGALISRVVTKGLDPDVPMKDSGVEWIGEIPAHWDLRRLKFACEIQSGLTLGRDLEDEETVRRPYLRVANVQDGYLELEDITYVDVRPKEIDRYELRTGDVLMTEGGDFDKLGRGYVWEGQIDGMLHQNHVFAVRPDRRQIDSHFMAYLTSSAHGKNYFTSTSQQTTNLATINQTKLSNFPLPIPPLKEQAGLLSYLQRETSQLDHLIDHIHATIEHLEEYRVSVISAAVTGQIDVRSHIQGGS